MSWGVLGVITGTGVNAPALRMAMNLVLKHIDADAAPASRGGSLAANPATEATGAPSLYPASSPGNGPSSRRGGPTSERPGVLAQDGRDSAMPHSSQHPRLYRGRPVSDD
jgi:hypothetical protein